MLYKEARTWSKHVQNSGYKVNKSLKVAPLLLQSCTDLKSNLGNPNPIWTICICDDGNSP